MITRPSFINELDWKCLIAKYRDDNVLQSIIQKIENNYPIQYAIGDVEFLNTKILVNENVLIPRFETELLVHKLIEYIKKYNLQNTKILDLCTGSGCIAIALKKNLQDCEVTGIDISPEALKVAKENADLNNVNVSFLKQNVLENINIEDKFSIIISNPPYVKSIEYVTPNTVFEPQIALYPGNDDLIFYKKILKNANKLLMKKSIIAFEIGATQGSAIKEFSKHYFPNSTITIEKDYNNFDRYVFIFNNLM